MVNSGSSIKQTLDQNLSLYIMHGCSCLLQTQQKLSGTTLLPQQPALSPHVLWGSLSMGELMRAAGSMWSASHARPCLSPQLSLLSLRHHVLVRSLWLCCSFSILQHKTCSGRCSYVNTDCEPSTSWFCHGSDPDRNPLHVNLRWNMMSSFDICCSGGRNLVLLHGPDSNWRSPRSVRMRIRGL